MNWNDRARELANTINPGTVTPTATAITGYIGMFAIVWRTGIDGLDDRFTAALRRAHDELSLEVYGDGISDDGKRRCFVVEGEEHDDTNDALFAAIHAALIVDGDEEGAAGKPDRIFRPRNRDRLFRRLAGKED